MLVKLLHFCLVKSFVAMSVQHSPNCHVPNAELATDATSTGTRVICNLLQNVLFDGVSDITIRCTLLADLIKHKYVFFIKRKKRCWSTVKMLTYLS